mmetsp:Transcript_23037/g.58699  ORF Transcript_23037/g.58699 Transcript_23037/m.58699 type:complete len:313 (-) Transcript_23037:117-1055(-)
MSGPSKSNGVLLVGTGARYARECALCAAILRSRGSLGLEHQQLHITMFVDEEARGALSSRALDRMHIFDLLRMLPPDARVQTPSWQAKLIAFLMTPYRHTLYLDCDVAPMWPEAPHSLLQLVSSDDDMVFTETWASRGFKHSDVLSHGRALLCSCILAWRSTEHANSVWRAALDLFNSTNGAFVTGHPRRGDQEAIYAVLYGKHRGRLAPSVRAGLSVRVLPLEWQCPTLLPQPAAQLTIAHVGYPSWPCRFTHWHPRTLREAIDAVTPVLNQMTNGSQVVAALLSGESHRSDQRARLNDARQPGAPLSLIQ